MKRSFSLAAVVLMASATLAFAAPKGTFRQAHEYGFGAKSSLDPIAKGRVFQITEKLMNRLVRPGLDGKPQADLAERWSTNADATIWTMKRPTSLFPTI